MIVHKAMKYPHSHSHVAHNVCDKADPPSKGKFIGPLYNEDELAKLFKAAEGTNLELPILSGAYYGLRTEEVLGLRWHSIDWQYKRMAIRHTCGKYSDRDQHHKLIFADTIKTTKTFRTVPLSDFMIEKLMAQKQRQEKIKTLFGNRCNHQFDDYVCAFENGNMIRHNWLIYHFRKFLEENGFRKIRFYDLRHSCATMVRHEGVPMETIQRWLGRSFITIAKASMPITMSLNRKGP